MLLIDFRRNDSISLIVWLAFSWTVVYFNIVPSKYDTLVHFYYEMSRAFDEKNSETVSLNLPFHLPYLLHNSSTWAMHWSTDPHSSQLNLSVLNETKQTKYYLIPFNGIAKVLPRHYSELFWSCHFFYTVTSSRNPFLPDFIYYYLRIDIKQKD
jgi:hypothetical protein